ncbi:MAG: O-antigen ligase family protein [Bacteroidota bacterium]
MIYYKEFNNKNVYLVALATLAIGLPWSNLLMSIAQIILIVNWIFGLDFKNKFALAKQNTSLLLIVSLSVLHLVGLLYSSNFTYAFKDIINKLPLFVLPLVIATSKPLAKFEFKFILYFFCAATVITTFLNLGYYFGIFVDINHPSGFFSNYISHIRYSLVICLAIFILFNYAFRKSELSKKCFVLAVISIVWLIVYLFLLKSLTGIIVFFVVTIAIFFYFSFIQKQNFANRWIFISLLIIFIFTVFSFYNVVKKYYETKPLNWKTLELKTINGNNYEHNWLGNQRENGNYVGVYVCWVELEKEWVKKSTKNYMGEDSLGQSLRFTLIRYLASKNLRKDSVGLNALSAHDIKMIESGATNFLPKQGLHARVEMLLFEFENYMLGGNPSGHSVAQRLEYWKTAMSIIKQNFWFGVGTGDVSDSFKQAYIETNSPLDERWRLRAHNQYISIFVAFGAFGFLIFFASLFSPIILLYKKSTFNYVVFLIIVCLSFLTEDTLETQAGVTFFAFFNSYLLFAYRKEKQK